MYIKISKKFQNITMETIMFYSYRFLENLFENHVEPVTLAINSQSIENGDGSASKRAILIRQHLVQMYAEKDSIQKEDIIATYEVAKSLITDLCDVVLEDAHSIPNWASTIISRTINRQTP